MSHQVNQLVSQLVEAWNAHDADRAASFFAADFEGFDVAQAQPERGPEGVRGRLGRYLLAFPDLRLTKDETIVERDRAALIWTARGTHRGPLMNIPATGRPICVRGMSLLTVKDGKISRALHIWDAAGLLRSIGLLPDL